MKKKLSKEVIGLFLLLIVFIVVGLYFTPTAEQGGSGLRTVGLEGIPDPSIYNDRSHGSRALFELTNKLGYRTQVDKVDWSHLPKSSHLLISVAPEATLEFATLGSDDGSDDSAPKLSADDARGVETWLGDGRTLLLLTSKLPAKGSVKDETADDKSADDEDQPLFGDILGVNVETTQEGNQRYFVPLQPSPLAAGVASIHLSSGSSRAFRDRRDYVSLFATVVPLHDRKANVEPAVLMYKVGKGRVIVVADDFFASNRNLSYADNAAFISNVISTSALPGSVVLFDEYHHGDVADADESDLWTAMGRPLRALAWQLALICLLIVAMVSPRFGPIKSLYSGGQRTTGEYLSSLAGLYRRAQATVPALEIIYRQFLRDLCERLALPPDVPLEKLAEAAARHSNINPNSLKRLIVACESALDNKQLSSNDLLTLTKQMEQVKRQLK